MGVLTGGGYRGTTFWRAIDRYYVASKRARKRGAVSTAARFDT